jgi:hypothetical protein
MNINRWIAVACLVLGLHTQAQTPTSAPAPAQPVAPTSQSQPVPGPSMEQTLSFINDVFTKDGDLRVPSPTGNMARLAQSLQSQGACLTEYRTITKILDNGSLFDGDHNKRTIVHFDGSDPLSVTVLPVAGTEFFAVVIKKALTDNIALSLQDQAAHALAVQYVREGIIRSLSSDNMTFVSDLGEWIAVPLGSVDQVTDSTGLVASSTLEVGDLVYVIQRSATTVQKKGHPALASFTNSIAIERKPTSNLVSFNAGVFKDKDVADHVAKAYIHAMVLCHKPETPSLF